MSSVANRAMDAYAKVDVELGVMNASPQALVVMLYDGAIKAIGLARADMLRKACAAKGQNLSKAIGIIDEGLKASLDLEAGGEIAANLAALYDYMTRQLMLANLRDDVAALDEVTRLLRDLKGAWESLVALQPARVEAAGESLRTRAPASYGKV